MAPVLALNFGEARAQRLSGYGTLHFDPAKHELRATYDGLLSACSSLESHRREERYRVGNDHLILIHKQVADNHAGNLADYQRQMQEGVLQPCTLTISDLIDGTMRVTDVRRFDLEGKPIK